jgi:rod shape-determining protein MreD
MGARVPFAFVLPSTLIAVLIFPVAAWIVARLDRWRLGR